MISSPLINSLQASLSGSFNRFGGNSNTFRPRTGVIPGSEVTANRIYPRPLPTDDSAITIPAGCYISFDGTAWLTGAQTWPAGAKWVMVKAPASADFSTLITYQFVFGGVTYNFSVTTMINPVIITGFPYDLPLTFSIGA